MICPVHAASVRHPESPALVWYGVVTTYAALDRQVGRWVTSFKRHGVRRSHRVALLSHNHPSVVAAHFALARLGAVAVPLNARLTAAELGPLLQRVKPVVTLASPELRPVVSNALDLHTPPPDDADPGTQLHPDDIQAILFTSGTTGTPKGAMLPLSAFIASAEASGQRLGSQPTQRWLGTLPLFHVGGLAMMWRCAVYGATLLLEPRFDEARVLTALRDDGVTHLSVVPTMLHRLLDAGLNRATAPALRVVLVGGAPMPEGLRDRAQQAGLPVVQTYGLTEACSQVCTQRVGEHGQHAGPPLPGVEVRIGGPQGASLPAGTVGEILVRGPTLMRGHLDDETTTAAALRHGWLHTGDLGFLGEDGCLRVVNRRTDLIIRGGENVYPVEVEQQLSRHPDILDAAVLPAPDDTWGSVPHALVVSRGTHLDERALHAWCRQRLAAFKVPTRFVVVPALPRNALGKLDRAEAHRLLHAGGA
ncbi:MAG: o-succinylbenzoate--CoA ligase [Myxococcota bacterium]